MNELEDRGIPFKNDPKIQDLFDSAKTDGATDEQEARIGRRLTPLFAAGTVLSASKAAYGLAKLVALKSAVFGSAWGKAALGGAVVLGLVGSGALVERYWLSEKSTPNDASQPAAPQGNERNDDRADGVPHEQPKSPSAAVEEHSLPAKPKAPPARPTAETHSGGKPETSAPSRAPSAREARQLLEARQALESDPGQALRLVKQHAAAFPNSTLQQEREVIRISALAKLGRKSEAEQGAARFQKAYPNSVHTPQLEELGTDVEK